MSSDRPKDSWGQDALPDLLSATTVRCRFDPGNGAHLEKDDVAMYEFSYQGGTISYESINLKSGTARMTGGPGAIGSREGSIDVMVTATRAGLHFSAFNVSDELVVTSVFGLVDKQGRHLAVVTTHVGHAFAGTFRISYHLYGACDTGSQKSRDTDE